MNIGTVRTELAAAVNALGGSLKCYAYVPSDGPTPFAYWQLESVTYDRTMRQGSEELVLTLMVMASRADDRASQELIDGYLSSTGSSSLKAAVEAANGAPGVLALNGAADFVHVTGTDGPPRWYEWEGGAKYHGAGLRVRVIGSGG